MTSTRILTASAATLALLAGGAVATATATAAPHVTAPKTIKAPAKAPVSFPGANKRRVTRGRLFFSARRLARDHTMTVGISCRRPGRLGSIAPNPRFARQREQQERVCARSAYLMVELGRLFTGTVFMDEPVAVVRASGSGDWVRVITDRRSEGWLETGALCGHTGRLRFGKR